MTATDRAALELGHINYGRLLIELEMLEDCGRHRSAVERIRALLADHECLSREVERLRASALCLVDEYRSHGGKGTHQECMPGCGCALPAQVTLLEAEVRAAHANGTACLLREEPKP